MAQDLKKQESAVADSVSSDNVNVEVINANETSEFETITVPA